MTKQAFKGFTTHPTHLKAEINNGATRVVFLVNLRKILIQRDRQRSLRYQEFKVTYRASKKNL